MIESEEFLEPNISSLTFSTLTGSFKAQYFSAGIFCTARQEQGTYLLLNCPMNECNF